MDLLKKNSENRNTVPWKLIVIFVFFTISIVVVGTLFYKSQKNRIFEEQHNNLTAVAILKIDQIERWYRERSGDAELIKENLPLIRVFEKYIKNETVGEDSTEIRRWMESLNKVYDFRSVLLVDTAFKVRYAVIPSDTLTDEIIRDELNSVLRSKKVVFTDLHRSPCISYVHMDVLIPLLIPDINSTRLIGILMLRIDPSVELFPLIQSWPTPSKSSETLLIRKEGDSVLYLNDLRHIKNTSLDLKIPLSNKDILASKAIAGITGVIDGVDYRKVPVIGFLAGIRGTLWYMIAKIDKKEVEEPLKRYSVLAVIVIILLIIINAAIFGSWIWKQRIRSYRERLEAEESQRVSEERYRRTFEFADIGISLTALDGSLTNINNSFCDFLGYSKEELAKMGFAHITHPDDLHESVECVRLLLAGEKQDYRMEKRYIRKDGITVWADVSTMILHDDKGTPLHFITHIVDITERKRLEQERFRLIDIIEKSLNEIYVFYADTLKFDYVNPAAMNNIGYSYKELKELTPVDIKPDYTEKQFRKLIQPLESREMRRIVFETIHRRKNGSEYPVEVYLQFLEEENRNLFYAIINDITHRKIAEKEIHNMNNELENRVFERTEQLAAANKELEAFSYSVSHDLRAPLRSIHGFANILAEEYHDKLDDEGKRLCEIITSSANQMGGLIDDLLNFSRIGRSSLNPLMIDMEFLVNSVFAGLTGEKEGMRTNLKVGRLHEAYGDANLIRIVWNNLISNAIKYSSKEKMTEITIESQLSDNNITYSIADNGVGFDMQYMHKLFGVFQRLHSEDEFEGNGVGLAIIQRIILRHGGRVWAEGKIDEGATFYFTLPASGGGE